MDYAPDHPRMDKDEEQVPVCLGKRGIAQSARLHFRQNDTERFAGTKIDIPINFRVHARTVLLSLVNAGLLPTQETATVLGIHAGHCRELARKLASHDVVESLVDKRRGQQRDYVVGSEKKAEIIQQLAARAITGQSTSSKLLAEVVNERTQAGVSARTVRWHIQKLGLTRIEESLPRLVETLMGTACQRENIRRDASNQRPLAFFWRTRRNLAAQIFGIMS